MLPDCCVCVLYSTCSLQTLYESAVAFGMRKALQTEQGKNEMENRIGQLETDVKDLERQVQEWKLKCEAIEKRENERREAESKKHKEEVQYLETYAKQLKAYEDGERRAEAPRV